MPNQSNHTVEEDGPRQSCWAGDCDVLRSWDFELLVIVD